MPKIRRMLWNQLHLVYVYVSVHVVGDGGCWKDCFCSYCHAYKGFHSHSHLHQMNLNFSIKYIFQWHTKYSNQFFSWSIIYCTASVHFLVFDCQSLALSFFLNWTLFARISFRQHKSIFNAKAWKYLVMLLLVLVLLTETQISDVCFYLFVGAAVRCKQKWYACCCTVRVCGLLRH